MTQRSMGEESGWSRTDLGRAGEADPGLDQGAEVAVVPGVDAGPGAEVAADPGLGAVPGAPKASPGASPGPRASPGPGQNPGCLAPRASLNRGQGRSQSPEANPDHQLQTTMWKITRIMITMIWMIRINRGCLKLL